MHGWNMSFSRNDQNGDRKWFREDYATCQKQYFQFMIKPVWWNSPEDLSTWGGNDRSGGMPINDGNHLR
jgi:hypothetical protein